MKIKFVNGEYAGTVREFNDSLITIGREDGNSIQILTEGVSRYHAEICKNDDGSWIISDLDSTNGVKIDGVQVIGERVLCAGDELVIGEQKLLIVELGNARKVLFQAVSASNETLMETKLDEKIDVASPQTSPLAGEKLLAELKSAGSELFNRKKAPNQTPDKPAGNGDTASRNPRSKTLFNVIFYAALVICIACVVKMLLGTPANTNSNASANPGTDHDQTVIYFERIDYDVNQKTAFRVELKIEKSQLSCVLDDISGQRHFERKIDLRENYDTELEVLIQKLKKSGILTLKAKNISLTNPERDRLHLVFIADNKMCNYQCSSMETGIEFDKCYQALRDFLNGFGLVTVAQNRDEVEEEARQHLRNAKDKMENYVSDLTLLREAAKEFEAAISCYEQFSPAPPELKQARTGFAEVNALRIKKLKEAQTEFTRCKRIGDERGMLHACQDIMKITGERSKAYREAAEILRQVKRQMNAKKR